MPIYYDDAAIPKDDPRNPVNFSNTRKWHIVCAGMLFCFNSNLGSSLPSGGTDVIAAYFGVGESTQLVLLNSLYLIGFALGPLIFGPMSEHLGRRIVLIGTYLLSTIFTMACALSPTYPALLAFRLLCGIVAATPNAVLGGLYADIYDNPRQRGKAMAYFMYVATLGPQLGPVLSGFASLVSWRLPFWIALGIAGAGLPFILTIPETYLPILCKRTLLQKDKERGEGGPAPPESNNGSHGFEEVKIIFTRPFVMLVREPIVLFTSLYLSLVYAILYLFFQAYPIVFKGIYGMTNGRASVAFLPVIGGATVALAIFLWYSAYHERALAGGATWAKSEEYRRLPVACIGAPAVVIAMFWFGWSSSVDIHPIVPMLSGASFGAGYLLVFMAMLNYLGDAYKQFSASAQAAASTTRAISAVCLPLATTPMYRSLGVAWASSLLGFLSLLLAFVPFAFLKYGHAIRSRSPFAQEVLRGLGRRDERQETEEIFQSIDASQAITADAK
ncbi:MFS general substrate transporter [Thozetella sp. PMI_491]|nr:MFS general substrate transporter [Thozetella sp. PMI_491]